jgi:hypothetical protein
MPEPFVYKGFGHFYFAIHITVTYVTRSWGVMDGVWGREKGWTDLGREGTEIEISCFY